MLKHLIPSLALLCSAGLCAPIDAAAQSPYVGQEHRAIKTLSDEDVDDLLNGRGWGLAKAAELNGVPGPLHVLELRDRLALSADQIEKIEAVRRDMKSEAMPLGEEFVALEKALNESFARRSIDSAALEESLAEIARVHARLRFVHLDAHLKTLSILSHEQVSAYNRLRGYDTGDPCSNVPEGHDPDLWRRHNGCK